jgi:hypothetical protein
VEIESAADLPRMLTRDGLGDGDGDGLPGWRELMGFRNSKGQLIATDPTAFDSDGDGLGDAIEIGQRQVVDFIELYDGTTDARNADSDGDGLSDGDEARTSATQADTDRDGLDDLTEILEDFDPTHANPDGDSYGDAAELARNSDPFTYDLTPEQIAMSLPAALIVGEGGAEWLGYPSFVLQSPVFIITSIVAGFAPPRDVIDAVVELLNGNGGEALFNLIAIVPGIGDGSKAVRVITKWATKYPHMRGVYARWVVEIFSESATAQLQGRFGLMKLAAPSTSLKQQLKDLLLKALGWNGPLDPAVDDMAKARNDLGKLSNLITGNRLRLLSRSADMVSQQNARRRMSDPSYWDQTKLRASPATQAEAYAVEMAVEWLQDNGYTVLYVQRNLKAPQRPHPKNKKGIAKTIGQGPDIIAVRPDGNDVIPVIVEVKGGINKTYLDQARLRSSAADPADQYQLARSWLTNRAEQRYLNRLTFAQDPLLQQAAGLIDDISLQSAEYEVVIFASGPTPTFGRLDALVETGSTSPRNALNVTVVIAEKGLMSKQTTHLVITTTA